MSFINVNLVTLSDCVFKNLVTLSDCVFKNLVTLSDCVFKNLVTLSDCVIKNLVTLSDCVFKNLLSTLAPCGNFSTILMVSGFVVLGSSGISFLRVTFLFSFSYNKRIYQCEKLDHHIQIYTVASLLHA